MRRLRRFLVLAGGVCLAIAAAPGGASVRPVSPRHLPRLRRSSLIYVGSFRLPAPQRGDGRTFDYGGTALAYDPTRNGLFAVGHAQFQLTAEVSIPRPRRARRVDRLPRARYLQGFSDATGGLIDQPPSCCGNDVGGQLVMGGGLY